MKPKPRKRKEAIGDILLLLSRMPLLFIISIYWWWEERLYGPRFGNRADLSYGHYMQNDPRSFMEKLKHFVRKDD